MSLVTPDQVQARGIGASLDDAVLQDIIDEQEAWLARAVGPLIGDRTETFEVGYSRIADELHLRRFTDAVVVADGATTLIADQFWLIERGSAIRRFASRAAGTHLAWTGPFVDVTYEPNDLAELTSALYALIGLAVGIAGASAAAALGPFESEDIGDYSYTMAGGESSGSGATAAQGVNAGPARAAIIAGLLPKPHPILSIRIGASATPQDADPWVNVSVNP